MEKNLVHKIKKPEKPRGSPLKWLHVHLFSSYLNTLLTLIITYIIWKTLPPFLNWIIFDANFVGETRESCSGDGACWVFVKNRLNQFIYGFYPTSEQWRVNISAIIVIGTTSLWFTSWIKNKKWLALWSFIILPILSWKLLNGTFIEPMIDTSKWGGVFLTFVVAIVGIICSLPLGVLLALGRQSKMPTIKTLSVLFIELWRGVPLITVLFMSSVMLPLFFPEGVHFDKLLRALIGVALFSSAYMAEVVRGGLQAIPKGQYEAAKALGLNYWQAMSQVIMPQALKIVIPGIVNTFIGLFKDTTLVAIIGLFDVLGIVQLAATDPDWLGYTIEGYAFAALFFWFFSYAMSKYSQHLEIKLNTQVKG